MVRRFEGLSARHLQDNYCFPIILLALIVNKGALTKTRKSESAGSRRGRNNLMQYSHFKDKPYKAQRGDTNSSRSQSWSM